MPQVKNKVTGMVLTIPDDQVAFMSSQWEVVGAAPPASGANKATLYGPNGVKEVVDIGSSRASELQSRGWGLTEGSYRAPVSSAPPSPPSPSAPPAGGDGAGKATLYGPNGAKEVVDVGSGRAAELQGQGWGLTEGSYKAPGDITKPVAKAAFKDTDAYKALPQEIRDFIDIAYNLIEVGGEEEAKQFSNAIRQAQAVADPYYRTQLALAKAEVLGSIAEKNSDFETRSELIRRTRDELMADVSANKDFLSLEQQADIARTAQAYDEDLLNIADQAAEAGVTFATGARSRALAESRRQSQYQDVVQSSSRKFNLQRRELELKAQRGDVSAQKELDALRASRGFALQGIGRAAEEVLGSANLPAIEGYAQTGGAIGKIEEEKRKAITTDVAGFLQLQKGFI